MADRHAAMIEEIYDIRGKTGMRSVEHLNYLEVLGKNVVLFHMLHVNDQEIQMLKEHSANVVHCPSMALKLVYGLSAFG
jgi:cytosine/adenosine deaminase-related metal-dependent hydrolase